MGRTVTTRRVAKRASADDISRQGSSFDNGLLIISEDQVDVVNTSDDIDSPIRATISLQHYEKPCV